MLVFNSLFMHLVFPNRILVTWAVEVDEVPFIRNFQNRMISGQCIFTDCMETSGGSNCLGSLPALKIMPFAAKLR